MPKPSSGTSLHPRNRHPGRYDFAALIRAHAPLARFVITNPYGKPSIDFANPEAVRVFNRALLEKDYGIRGWDIPADYLCPPVPGRADYLHHLADLLASSHDGVIPQGPELTALDIGCGANCIYPLIGRREYGWSFIGADIDGRALDNATAILAANPELAAGIELRRQANPQDIFHGLIGAEERIDLTLCNPPFHASADEALAGSRRKWKNLGKLAPERQLPVLNFGGRANELHCPGGEAAFLARMAEQSRDFAEQVFWFSSLVSKAANVEPLEARLRELGVTDLRVIAMGQGNKRSRLVAWTFLDKKQRRAWRRARWPGRTP